jgi:large subunit ribosomal protein L5
MASRLKIRYREEIKPQLKEELEIANAMLIPAVEKVVISVGTGFAMKDKKLLDNVAETISAIAGQKALVIEAKKSVAGFKVREGMSTGVKVTLRDENMYEFLDKLINVALPRVKDFRGIPRNGFDGRGNYNFGLTEQLIFPEVKYDDIMQIHGMNITVVTTTNSDKEALSLLEKIGLPFTKARNNG